MPHRKTIAIVATTLAGAVSRASSLLSQVIVGLYLTEQEVGVYALAIGIMGVTAVWRNGGSGTFLPSIKPESFDRLANPMFLWATAFGLATTLLTLAIAAAPQSAPGWLVGGAPTGLSAVLTVFAIRAALSPIALIGRMRLSVEHRFVPLAKLDTANAMARLLMTAIIAIKGGGALALAIPYAIQVPIEIAVVGLLGGLRRQDFVPSPRALLVAAPLLGWPLVLAVFTSVRLDLSFLMISMALPTTALGVFYFAFQLANQPTMFLATSLQNVLAPILARSRGNPQLERIGLERVFAGAMLFVPITTMAAASMFDATDQVLWGGRWQAAVPSVMALCVGATYATVAGLIFGPLIGLQRFKEGAAFEVIKTAGVAGGAIVGGVAVTHWSPDSLWGLSPVTCVSLAVAAGMVVTSLAQLLWIANRFGFDRTETARHLTFGPLLAALTAVAAQSIGHSLRMSLDLPEGRAGAAVELFAIAVIYAVLITLAVRFTAESTLTDTLAMLPARVRGIAGRLLRISGI